MRCLQTLIRNFGKLDFQNINWTNKFLAPFILYVSFFSPKKNSLERKEGILSFCCLRAEIS